MSQATITGVINGVNADRMGGMIQTVQQNPNMATFQFRAKNQWMAGGHNRSTIQGFYGAGQEYTSRKAPFVGGWNDWYANWQASGGLVLDMLVHDFDFLRWSFGEVERVYAKSLLGREYNRVDYALVTLRFRNSVIAHVEGHWGYPDPFWYSVEVAGTKALASVDSRKYAPARILVNERTIASGNGESPGSSLGQNPYQLELEHFVRCVETGEEPIVSEVDGYEALRISLAATESAMSRVPISLRGS